MENQTGHKENAKSDLSPYLGAVVGAASGTALMFLLYLIVGGSDPTIILWAGPIPGAIPGALVSRRWGVKGSVIGGVMGSIVVAISIVGIIILFFAIAGYLE
jgi:hypothetical protein